MYGLSGNYYRVATLLNVPNCYRNNFASLKIIRQSYHDMHELMKRVTEDPYYRKASLKFFFKTKII